ncbi:ethylene-responsive transcription factor 5-like [Vigna radiata var. radiata]|uniref:Ethylene-responsive transcription factor 5-like n=1 Tax=Vigna radiata var. radiata TaxID=3916 RepID=A0A1S3UBE4_VIGRR|nr:ethylene-responsive transcription factor 5-like [Vigna radiata var. radiata]
MASRKIKSEPSTIEAAKAYDHAAFRLYSSKVILNFPLKAGAMDATADAEGERKRRCEEEEVEEVKLMVKKEKTTEQKVNPNLGLIGLDVPISAGLFQLGPRILEVLN